MVTASRIVGGVELRNVRVCDIDLLNRTLTVRVGKNRFRIRILPLNQTALWAVERLLECANGTACAAAGLGCSGIGSEMPHTEA